MAGGVSMTSVDFFTRSESKIVGIDRLTDLMPGESKLKILFDDYIKLDNEGAVNVRDFASLLPNQELYDIHFTNASLEFDGFDDYIYYWG